MRREKMVGAGKQYAPTLYTVLVNPDDDQRLFGYYPTLAGETETYLSAKAAEEGLVMDGQPLVRFVVDDSLKHGKFDIIAEAVASPIVAQLREEEMARYGLAPQPQRQQQQFANPYVGNAYADPYAQQPQQAYAYNDPRQQQQPYYNQYDQAQPADPLAAPVDEYYYDEENPNQQPQQKPPLPYVPEDEIDYSIDYGEYTFNSEDFEDYRRNSQQVGAHAAHGRPQQQQQQPQAQAQQVAAQAAQAAQAGAAGAYAAAPQQAPNTVNFTGQPQGQPNQRQVRARVIDIAYQRAYDLAGTRITIGRESDNDIVIQDINASRHHAQLTLTPQGVWTITDMRSTNGTLVNGVLVASQPLQNGDRICIGKTNLEFVLG